MGMVKLFKTPEFVMYFLNLSLHNGNYVIHESKEEKEYETRTERAIKKKMVYHFFKCLSDPIGFEYGSFC